VSLEVEVNLNSLAVVRDEVEDGIAQSATEFEAFLADQSKREHLGSSIDKIVQIGGTFRLLEFPGAALLADEMALLLRVIDQGAGKNNEAMLKALTQAYFVLPRYIEYVATEKKALPILVVPYANEMRVSRRADLLPEHHFFSGDIALDSTLPPVANSCQSALLAAGAKRLSHMFQTGFVGLMQEPGNALHYQYSLRALNRVVSLLGDHPGATVLRVAAPVMAALAEGKLELTLNRKRTVASIEKLLRAIASNGEASLTEMHSDAVLRDLLFMLMLSTYDSPDASAVRTAFSLPLLATSDDDIVARRALMHGPNQDTMETVVRALSEELRGAKDVLELCAQQEAISDADSGQLGAVINRVADTLSILNLSGPRAVLMEQLPELAPTVGASDAARLASLQRLADALLYVESALSSLDRRQTTVAQLNAANADQRSTIVADSYLAQAQRCVFDEAKSGINNVKQSISSYLDANFDNVHIASVAATLNTVGGGLQVLKYQRAAAVLKSCAAFVDSHIKQSRAQDQHHQLLETLADTLISLEYYLDELEFSHRANDKILDIAEEGLAALGFAIEQVSVVQ